MSQDEESLTTPPSETNYFEQNKTPAKRSSQGSPLTAMEEESLITPPSERYVTEDDDTRTDANVVAKTPRKAGPAGYDDQVVCTPLKVDNRKERNFGRFLNRCDMKFFIALLIGAEIILAPIASCSLVLLSMGYSFSVA